MESCTHNIMAMACKNSNNTPILPIPEPHRLIITTRNNPRQFFMELYSSDIVKMTGECEHTFLRFIVPNFDLVVITTTDEHWLCFMEVNTSNRT